MRTILASFDNTLVAQNAVSQLIAQGFSKANIHLQFALFSNLTSNFTIAANSKIASVGNLFDKMFSAGGQPGAGLADEVIRPGRRVVIVDASSDAEVQRATAVMAKLGTLGLAGNEIAFGPDSR